MLRLILNGKKRPSALKQLFRRLRIVRRERVGKDDAAVLGIGPSGEGETTGVPAIAPDGANSGGARYPEILRHRKRTRRILHRFVREVVGYRSPRRGDDTSAATGFSLGAIEILMCPVGRDHGSSRHGRANHRRCCLGEAALLRRVIVTHVGDHQHVFPNVSPGRRHESGSEGVALEDEGVGTGTNRPKKGVSLLPDVSRSQPADPHLRPVRKDTARLRAGRLRPCGVPRVTQDRVDHPGYRGLPAGTGHADHYPQLPPGTIHQKRFDQKRGTEHHRGDQKRERIHRRDPSDTICRDRSTAAVIRR